MIFHNLVYLTLNTCVHGWWDLVTHMLQDSPKLRFLKLIDDVSGLFFFFFDQTSIALARRVLPTTNGVSYKLIES